MSGLTASLRKSLCATMILATSTLKKSQDMISSNSVWFQTYTKSSQPFEFKV